MTVKQMEQELLALQDQRAWATTPEDKTDISNRYRELHARWMARKGLSS